MQVFAVLVAVVAGALLLWWRARPPRPAAASLVDGSLPDRAKVLRLGAENGGFDCITAIDDPLVAAASLFCLVAGSGWPAARPTVEAQLAEVAHAKDAAEAIAYAEWVARQDVDTPGAIETLAARLYRWLDAAERARIAAMIQQVAYASPDSPASAARATARLMKG